MSIHIGAEPGQIAPTVLLPGDPLRAKFIAETMLEDAVCFNEVRGMLVKDMILHLIGTYGAAGAFKVNDRVSVVAEMFGRTGLGALDLEKSPLEVGGGVRIKATKSFQVMAGAGAGLRQSAPCRPRDRPR